MEDERDWFTRWYDRRSMTTLIFVGLSPMITIAVVLFVIALIWS